MTGLINPAV